MTKGVSLISEILEITNSLQIDGLFNDNRHRKSVWLCQ